MRIRSAVAITVLTLVALSTSTGTVYSAVVPTTTPSAASTQEQPWYASDPNAVPVGRFRDYSPFWGGSRIVRAGVPAGAERNGQCTAGFGGLNTVNGVHYMITAAHCVNLQDRRFWSVGPDTNNNGVYMGNAITVDVEHDVAFIRTDVAKATTEPRIYDDSNIYSWNSKRVVGTYNFFQPAEVCISGSFSGTRCAGIVWGRHPHRPHIIIIRHRDPRQHLIRHGDSGGPAFIFLTTNGQPNGQVRAAGIVSVGLIDYAGAQRFRCPDDTTNWCYPTVGIVDINWITEHHPIDLTR